VVPQRTHGSDASCVRTTNLYFQDFLVLNYCKTRGERRTDGHTKSIRSAFFDETHDVTRYMQDRRFPSIESSLGVTRSYTGPSVDDRLLPTGLSHDAAASAPWLTRRSIVRSSLAAVEKTSPTEDTRCCSCRFCRSALRRFLVIIDINEYIDVLTFV